MSMEGYRASTGEDAQPGAALAAARAAENLTVAEVARHLKLSVAQVEALEADDFDRLPGPVFVRGFVRNYARLVKLDADALLERVEPGLAPHAASPETPPSKDIPFPPRSRSRWPLLMLLVLLAVTVLAVHEFYTPVTLPAPAGVATPPPSAATRSTPVPPAEPAAADAAASGAPAEAHPATPAAAADSGAPPASTAAGAAAPNSDASPTAAQAAAPPAEEAPAVAEAAPAAAPANAEDTPGASASAGAGTQPQSRGQLHFVFEDESWVEVRERGGKIIFSRLNPAGTEEEVAGEPPLELVIGNADSVRLTYDGDPVDLAPHTRVDVARFALP